MNKINYLIKEPLDKYDFRLFFLRFSQIMHNKTNGIYNIIMQKMFKLIKPKVVLPKSRLLSYNQIETIVNNLNQKGYDVLPITLKDEQVESLIDFCKNNKMYDDEGKSYIFDYNKIYYEKARYYWKMQDLIENDIVIELMSDSFLSLIAQNYLETKPILTSISLWLDPPSENKSYQPHIYHQDNDGIKYLKFFFYLTDVDEESCPHRFIKGTHKERKPKKFSMTKRYTNEELLDYYGKEKEVIFTAKAGTIIAEDTKGFHRGTTPKTKYRLLMQMEFAITDIPVYFSFCEDRFIKKLPLKMEDNLINIYKKFYK
jgi:hypothetical protein